MGLTKWVSVSLPEELVKEIEEEKPTYMSIAEYVRTAVNLALKKEGVAQ